jgi:hypothetical protein
MRAMFSLLFIFSILSDFTFSFSDIGHIFTFGTDISCVAADIECLSGVTSDQSDEEEHHCHCHVGHVHTTIFFKEVKVQKCPSYFLGQVYYDQVFNYYYNYLAEISRPPIA